MKLQHKIIEKLRLLINEEIEYRTGPQLVTFFNDLGLKDNYGPGFPSRRMYTEEHLKRMNGTNQIAACIKKLFLPVNFINNFDKLDQYISEFNTFLAFDDWKIIRRGKNIELIKAKVNFEDPKQNLTEDEFLNQEFKSISIDTLGLEESITKILQQRLDEIRKCLKVKSALAAIFLCGSTLEGILLGIASKHPQKFNQCEMAPKDSGGKTLQFHKWNLNTFIDVSKQIGFLDEDVKKFSHVLRYFRNYIHPYQQAVSAFHPNEHTARICWQVLQGAICQLSKYT